MSDSPLTPLHVEITIAASCAHVYQQMLDEQGYRHWTRPFHPTSHYRGNWQTGSEMQFIALENGVACGMLSRVVCNEPARQVSLVHLGILQNGEAIYSGEPVAAFAGAREIYLFSPLSQRSGEGCLLQIEMDTTAQWRDYFLTSWPAALAALKLLCENQTP